ncbi:TetR/AcrR family transcriptional regulator [Kocuria rosea]|uniref:TetR/AcrR family transcriptional regulator n=1 Tax=Kocuria rosea TaxID=1275 RepID=UPI00203CC29B|nr:TetR/AcrR family transcriptional regulator [Kocuria rosea]
MSTTSGSSLRQQRRAETWQSIHEAAAALVLDHGIEGTTVEAIAQSAGVSPRTFFNYFRTKEDAVLGLRAPVLDPGLLEGFTVERDLLGQTSRLLLAVARSADAGGDSVRRRALLRAHPPLGQRRKEYMLEAEELVRQALADLLAADPQWSAQTQGCAAEELARMLVMLAGVPLRFALASPAYDTDSGVTPESLASALTLFHHVHRKLS